MKYRHHRGGLAESMATCRDVLTKNELVAAINEDSIFPAVFVGFQHIGIDERINWDTYYVIAAYKNKPGKTYVAGMSDGVLDNEYNYVLP